MAKLSKIHTYVFFGILLGVLLIVMQALEYRTMIKDLSLEIYGGIVALIFISLGTWIGISFFSAKDETIANPVQKPNPQAVEESGLSQRELEVLQLMARGHTNREIAGELFVSLNTVKTHASNIYFKLRVKRRTQAIQKARAMAII